jgi:hypothetical protein
METERSKCFKNRNSGFFHSFAFTESTHFRAKKIPILAVLKHKNYDKKKIICGPLSGDVAVTGCYSAPDG